MTFQEIHEYGAKQFGSAWLTLNLEIASTAMAEGLDVTDRKVKTALTKIALRILQLQKHQTQVCCEVHKAGSF
jgi:hypothetical protein